MKYGRASFEAQWGTLYDKILIALSLPSKMVQKTVIQKIMTKQTNKYKNNNKRVRRVKTPYETLLSTLFLKEIYQAAVWLFAANVIIRFIFLLTASEHDICPGHDM